MRLTPDVALIGSGMFGFDLSAASDCHVYLLDGGDDLALVDAGAGPLIGDTELLLRNIAADGYDPSRISRILLTHYHFDHMGGAAELQARLGCEIHASPLTARVLETGDEAAISLPGAKAAGYVPPEYGLMPAPAIGDMTDGARFRVGHLEVSVIETPGHADGHVSYLVTGGDRRHLVQGDVVFANGTIFLQNVADCSIQKYSESVRKLAQIEFDAFLPGHMSISLRNGKRHVDTAAAQFEKLMVPKNFV